MRSARLVWCLAAAGLSLAACGSGGGGDGTTSQTPEQDEGVRPLDDLGASGGMTVDAAPGGTVDAGTGGTTDAGPTPDSGSAVRHVENCAQACQVFADCGRVDVWNGTVDNCLAACNPVADDPRVGNFFGCVAVTACDNLETCQPPEPPPPTCADVCDAQTSCGGDWNLPASLPNVGACANACGDATLGPLVTRCGASVLNGVCDSGEFDRCLLGGLFGDCFQACQRLKDCDAPEAQDVTACTLACADVADSGDALVRHRQEGRDACIIAANGNCDEIGLCGQPAAHIPVGNATVDQICAANADCPIFPAETCPDAVTAALDGAADHAIDCLLDQMQNACADGPLYSCFRPAPTPAGTCDQHCLVANLCGNLPADQSEGVCVDECNTTLATGTPAGVGALQSSFLCDNAETCADVQLCLNAGGPIDLCRVQCGQETTCNAAASVQACEDACVAGFTTDRGRAERACVAATQECDAVGRCGTPDAPPCQVLCDLLDPCNLGGSNCLLTCDNADFAQPGAFLPRLACDASSDRCSARSTCEGGDFAGGTACLAYCQATVTCNGGDATNLVQCVLDCGNGLHGADGLTFDGAQACLTAAGADASCDNLQACLNDVAPDAFCANYCGALDHCGVADGALADCEAACAGRTGEADFLDNAACTLNAVRRGTGCAAVAACNNIEVPPATPACAAICTAEHTCDDTVDSFLCERECVADPAGDAARGVCAEAASCDSLHLCIEAGNDVPPDCTDVCNTISVCGADVIGPDPARFADGDACVADCAGNALLNNVDYAPNLAACLQGAVVDGVCDAAAVGACYSAANVDPICVDSWAGFTACGFNAFIAGGDQNQYYTDCMANLAMDDATTRTEAQCVIDTAAMANGDPTACFGLLQCFPGLAGGP